MLDTEQVLRLMLGTLALGVALPVMIQLFLLLRELRKTIARFSDQIEPTLRMFNEIAHRPQEPHPEGSQVASIVATIIPAAIAAYKAYRQHQTEEAADPAAEMSTRSPATSQ